MAALYANTPDAGRAQMAAASINDLPDSAFAYIEPGGKKDEQGKTVPRSKRHFPIHDAAHVRNALARAPQSPFGDKAMPKIRAAAKKFGIEVSGDSSSRSESDMLLPASDFIRAVALDDIRIRSGGTGRTVEAYAAVFDEPAEVADQDGHYYEVNHRDAFTRSIERHRGRFPVVYHHGMTLAGTPSERGSVPVGVSTEVRPDKRGVFTVSEYGRTELADEVLEQIRMGSIKAQSYGGRFLKSDPELRYGARHRPGPDGKLRTVTRLVIAMREFGPTPFPAFTNAAITGVRAQQMLGALLAAPADRRAALLDQLATPLDEVDPAGLDIDTLGESEDPVEQPQTDDPPPRHSRSIPLRTRIRAARIARGWE
jgi:HK97 family phage prohead protease